LRERVVEQEMTSPPDSVSSLLGDRLAGRPMAWNGQNGVIVRPGHIHEIETPVNGLPPPCWPRPHEKSDGLSVTRLVEHSLCQLMHDVRIATWAPWNGLFQLPFNSSLDGADDRKSSTSRS